MLTNIVYKKKNLNGVGWGEIKNGSSIFWVNINSLQKKTDILERSKLKVFADDKINFTKKNEISLGKDKKHCGKWRKCWLPAFSPFLTMFS